MDGRQHGSVRPAVREGTWRAEFGMTMTLTSAVSGVSSEGFITIVQPAARAGPVYKLQAPYQPSRALSNKYGFKGRLAFHAHIIIG